MAERKSLLMNHSDSNVLTVLDLVSGHLSNVELPHTEALDDIYPHQAAGKVWLDFDSGGGRVAAYLGDGQMDVSANDFAQAVFGTSTNSPGSTRQYATTTPIRVGKNANAFLKQNNDIYLNNGFEIRDQNDAMLFSPVASWMEWDTFQFPDGVLVGETVYGNSLSLNFDWTTEGFAPSSWFVRGGKVAFIYQAANQKNYVVEMTWDDVNKKLVYSDYFLLRDTATTTEQPGTSLGGSNNVISLENGSFFIRGGDQTYYLWDGVNGHEPVWQGGAFQFPDSESAINGYFSFGADASILDNNNIFGSFAQYETARTLGLNVTNVSITDGSITATSTPPLSALPVLTDNPNWYIDTTTNTSAGVVLAASYKDENNVAINMATIFVFDKTDYTNPIQQVSLVDYAKYLSCPLAEINDRDFVVINKQAYEVTGEITENNVPAAVPVMLLDNESGHICGRGESDPVTGVYYFRCWTNGSKSVLAKSPIDGGWRIAALRIPQAVG